MAGTQWTVFSRRPAIVAGLLLLAAGAPAATPADQADIAKKLNNPIADLINAPAQFNWDQGYGPSEQGERWVLNLQPVIPIRLTEDWNVISRTILPIVGQDDIPFSGGDASGTGDLVQSLFFSPRAPTARGWVWGVGPALMVPTASDELLGAERWAAGPTIVVLRQAHGWTVGALGNHLSDFAGDQDRPHVSATFLQPFLAYTTKTFTSLAINLESTYDWEAKEWSVPINFQVSQVFRIGSQPMSIQLGARYWADSPETAADGWGVRFTYTLVIPKG